MPTGNGLADALGGAFGLSSMTSNELEELKRQYAQQQAQYTQTATAAQLAQMQQQTTYGSNTATTTWTTPNTIMYPTQPGTATPYATITTWDDATQVTNQNTTLMLITLITAVGPEMCRRLLKKFKLQGLMTNHEFDALAKKVTGTLSGDDDEELEQVINDVAKEVKS